MRLVLLSALGILACSALADCAQPSMTLHPYVYVDPHFSAEETAGIWDGLRAWEAAAPAVEFLPAFESYDVAWMRAHYGEENHIHIFRSDAEGHGCPFTLAADIVGQTSSPEHTGSSQICIIADYVDTHDNRWTAITGHEVGHALGLSHMPPPSIMAVPYNVTSDHIECKDVQALYAAWHLGPWNCP
jgi:hypothetical protein